MVRRLFLVLTALLASTPVWAATGADLTTRITAPASSTVYVAARYTASVTNSGNKNASEVVLTIQLPQTRTSPQVYVMGTVGALSAGCGRTGTVITCNLGTLNRGKSRSVFFDLTLPYSTDAMVINTDVTTTSPEVTRLNNGSFIVASPATVDATVTTGVFATNRHCTGQPVLSSFFECTLFEANGAITSHESVFNGDGTISLSEPGYSGTWFVNPALDQLHFRYFEGTTLVAEFDGRGVEARCFEGKTTFPLSPAYVSLYRVCFP